MGNEKKFEQIPGTRPTVDENDEESEEAVNLEGSDEELGERIDYSNMSRDLKTWFSNLEDGGIRFIDDGTIQISRWERDDEARRGKKKIWQNVPDINSALRMQDHIIENYRIDSPEEDSEISELESIEQVIERANDLLTQWKSVSEEERSGIQDELVKVVLQLEKCRNEFKVKVHDQTEKVTELRDSKGRENPGALAARTSSALHNLSKRFSEMRIISPLISMRKEMLVFEDRRLVQAMKSATRNIQSVANHLFFKSSDEKRDSKLRADEVKTMDLRIGKSLHSLESVFTSPYAEHANEAHEFLIEKVKKNFRSKKQLIDNREEVQGLLLEASDMLQMEDNE